MQAEDRIGFRVLQCAVLDHQRRAAFFSGRRAFLGRLENEFDGAGQLVAHARQHFRHAHQDGHVGIVTARMHHADLLADVFGFHRGLERHVHFLDDRQRIHVGAQRNDPSRLAALEQSDHAGVCYTGLYFHAELAQMRRNQLAGANFAVRQLGMLMNVAPPCDDLGFDGADALVHHGREIVGLHRREGNQKTEDEHAVRNEAIHRCAPEQEMDCAMIGRSARGREQLPARAARAHHRSGAHEV